MGARARCGRASRLALIRYVRRIPTRVIGVAAQAPDYIIPGLIAIPKRLLPARPRIVPLSTVCCGHVLFNASLAIGIAVGVGEDLFQKACKPFRTCLTLVAPRVIGWRFGAVGAACIAAHIEVPR
jgi:hypothetical protein